MKKKAILSALFSAFVACFFVACSNDSDALDINAGTRSVTSSSYMTREEIQTRLDEIGEKYGTRVIFDNSVNKDSITEDVFINLEEQLSVYKNNLNSGKSTTDASKNESLFLDDSSIDDIVTMAAPPSGETYSGSFSILIVCGATAAFSVGINWTSGDNGLSNVHASLQMGPADYVNITDYSQIGGTAYNPEFTYEGEIWSYANGLLTAFKGKYPQN